MWVFTKLGFFSVVQDRDNPNWLHVRARTEEDMLDLYREAQALQESSKVQYDLDADYNYRVLMYKSTWAQIMDMLTFAIDYDNFKHEFEQHADKHDVLMDVWARVRTGWR